MPILFEPVIFAKTKNIPLFVTKTYITGTLENFNWHRDIEIIFAYEGEGKILSGSEYIPIQENDFAVINPYQLHLNTSETFCNAYLMIIDTDFFLFNKLNITEYVYDKKIHDEILKEKFFKIINLYMTENNTEYTDSQLCMLLLDFMIYLTQKHASKKDIGSQTNIEQIIGYIQAHYNEKITIDEISKQAGLSRYYLSRKFKELTGYTIIDYINILRCNEICRQLSSGAYTVNDCFRLSAFTDYSYFSKLFKKHIGISPSEYLKKSKECNKIIFK